MKFEDLEITRQKYETGVKELSKKRKKIISIVCLIVFSLEIVAFCLFNPIQEFKINLSVRSFIPICMLVVFALIFQSLIITMIVSISTHKSALNNIANFQAYKRAYKSYFIQKQLSETFSDIEYDHSKGLDKDLLVKTGLIYTGDIYKSNDLVKAK